MIHVHQSITCYHFAMSWAETPGWVLPLPKFKGLTGPSTGNLQSFWHLAVALQTSTSTHGRPTTWICCYVSCTNFDHLKFSHPKDSTKISASRKQKQLFFGPAVQARSVVGEKCHWSEAMITQAEPGIFHRIFCEILVFLLISEHYRNCEVPI